MDRQTATTFLTDIYKHQTSGKLVFHAFRADKAETFTADLGGDFFDWVEQREKAGWGIHLRQGRMATQSRSCTKKDVEQLCHLWVDIDRPQDKVSFVENENDPMPTPTFLINSGGGTHLYWRLDKPAMGIDLFQVEELNTKLADYVGGDPAPTHIASTRRLVGTLNHKYDPPVEASILRHNKDAEVSIDSMADWLKRNENPVEAFANRLIGNVRQTVDWKLVLDNLSVEGPANEFGGRNNCVTKLAGWWARQGIDPDTQLRTLQHHGCTLPVHEMESIVNRIYQKECESNV